MATAPTYSKTKEQVMEETLEDFPSLEKDFDILNSSPSRDEAFLSILRIGGYIDYFYDITPFAEDYDMDPKLISQVLERLNNSEEHNVKLVENYVDHRLKKLGLPQFAGKEQHIKIDSYGYLGYLRASDAFSKENIDFSISILIKNITDHGGKYYLPENVKNNSDLIVYNKPWTEFLDQADILDEQFYNAIYNMIEDWEGRPLVELFDAFFERVNQNIDLVIQNERVLPVVIKIAFTEHNVTNSRLKLINSIIDQVEESKIINSFGFINPFGGFTKEKELRKTLEFLLETAKNNPNINAPLDPLTKLYAKMYNANAKLERGLLANRKAISKMSAKFANKLKYTGAVKDSTIEAWSSFEQKKYEGKVNPFVASNDEESDKVLENAKFEKLKLCYASPLFAIRFCDDFLKKELNKHKRLILSTRGEFAHAPFISQADDPELIKLKRDLLSTFRLEETTKVGTVQSIAIKLFPDLTPLSFKTGMVNQCELNVNNLLDIFKK